MISKGAILSRIAIEKMFSSIVPFTGDRRKWSLISIYESNDLLNFSQMVIPSLVRVQLRQPDLPISLPEKYYFILFG